MLLLSAAILCIISGIATAALMSWLQPALESWAVTNRAMIRTCGWPSAW